MVKNITLPNKRITWTLHAIAWVIVILIPFYLNTVLGEENNGRLYQIYVHTFSAVVVFYLGYFWLVPRYFLQNKKAVYLLLVIALVLITYGITVFINDYLLFDPVKDAQFKEAFRKATGKSETPPFRLFGFFNHILTSTLISGFAMGLGVMEKLKQNEQKQKELEKEKLNSELAFLKNQVSPHFFFNTLNNIYSLIGIDGPTAQESVLKLSKLMRYLLYESEQGETLMSNEIDFMNNYIDLMKLRLSAKVELKVRFPRDFTDFSVPPLLFIPFIENAFKHGISYREHSFIHIRMEITKEQIIFITENSMGTAAVSEDLQHSGIGLNNVRKRLALLFPERHQLNIEQTDATFKATLSIRKEKQLI